MKVRSIFDVHQLSRFLKLLQ